VENHQTDDTQPAIWSIPWKKTYLLLVLQEPETYTGVAMAVKALKKNKLNASF
jgi:hypothetical protein